LCAARRHGTLSFMTTETPQMNRPRRLRRSTSDKKLAGVAGGLGDYFSVDPILFRIGFAIATLFSGIGAVAYLALYAFLPTDAGDPAPLGARPMAA
jgi:phage shock protein PspC (stress-responsive transcriptional regulator)